MNPGKLLKILNVAEKLKCNTRHCYTSSGRHESVAEHCWRTALMAMLLESEFPQADMNKVIKMILIHDLGEAFTGDIPCFNKTFTSLVNSICTLLIIYKLTIVILTIWSSSKNGLQPTVLLLIILYHIFYKKSRIFILFSSTLLEICSQIPFHSIV